LPSKIRLAEYVTQNGSTPVAEWLAGLRDGKGKAAILLRFERIALGNLGRYRAVGGGVLEMIVDVGPGYRIYFARRSADEVVLLAAGAKATQRRDIVLARHRLEDLHRRGVSSGGR
jgi:putative addiction module killer protein